MADFTLHDLDLPVQTQTAANGYAPDASAAPGPTQRYTPPPFEESAHQEQGEDDPLATIRKDAITPSPEAKYNSQYFDWQGSQAQKFANLPQYKELGYDPNLGTQIADKKYHEMESNGETAKRVVEGFGVGLGQGFVGMVSNLKNIGSVFSDPTLQSSFKKEQLEDINKKQQDFENNYYIPQGINPGILNGLARGLQSSGNFIGALAEVAAFSWLTGGIGGALGGTTEGAIGAVGAGTVEAEGVTELGLGASSELIANTSHLTDVFSKGATAATWANIGEVANKASSVLPIPGGQSLGALTEGTANVIGNIKNGGILNAFEGGSIATAARGFTAFANDINSINTATGFASGNAAATYQQLINDQVENYKKTHNGIEPDGPTKQGFQDDALKAAKVGGAIDAYMFLGLEKLAMGNLLNSRSTLQEAIEKSGRGVYDRVATKPFWAEGAQEEPLYIKQQAKWYDFKANLTNNYYAVPRELLSKGVEFGEVNNIMEGVDKGVRSYFDAKYDNKDIAFSDAILNGISGQFSKDGASTFISGFVQGALLLGIGSAALGKLKDAGLDRLQGRTDSGNRLGDIDAQNFVNQVNTAWKDPLNPIKNTIHDMVLQSAVGEGSKSALANGDRKTFHDFADDNQRMFLMKLIKNGLADAWVNKVVEKARNLNQEELNKFMGFTGDQNTPENYTAIKAQINELPGRVKEMRNIGKYIETKLPNPFNPYTKDPNTGKRLFADNSDEFKQEYNNRAIYEVAKDYVSTMKDVAEMAIVRQNKLLNGAEGTSGILDMPFTKNLGFSDIFTTTSVELLDKQIALYQESVSAGKDKESADRLAKTVAYKEKLTEYLKGYADILNEGGSADRGQRIKALDEKYKNQLSDSMYDYLDTMLTERNLKGKVTDRKMPPGKQEVIDGMDKMMDYYKLGVDHHAMLHQLNILLDPRIVKKFGMSVAKEANRRQQEAQEGNTEGVTKEEKDLMNEHQQLTSDIANIKKTGVVAETRANAQKVKQMQDRLNVINKRLEEIRNPVTEEPEAPIANTPPTGTTPEYHDVHGEDDVPQPKPADAPEPVNKTPQELESDRTTIKDFHNDDKNIHPEEYAKALNNYPELKAEISFANGIQADDERNKLIDEYFDKKLNAVTPKGEHPELSGNPHVEELFSNPSRYGVQVYDKTIGDTVTTVAEANRQLATYLEKNHPVVPGTDLRVGQTVYGKDHGNEFLIYGLDKKTDGNVVLKEVGTKGATSIPITELQEHYVSDKGDVTKPEENPSYTPFDSNQPKAKDPNTLVNAGIQQKVRGPENLTQEDIDIHTKALLSVPYHVWSTGEGLTMTVTGNNIDPNATFNPVSEKGANGKKVFNTQIKQYSQPLAIQLSYTDPVSGITQVLPEYQKSSSYIFTAPDGTTKTIRQLTAADVGALFQLTPKYPTNELMRQHLIETEQDNQKLQQLAKEALVSGGTINLEGRIQITPHMDYNFISAKNEDGTQQTGAKLSDIQDLQSGKHGLKTLIIRNDPSGPYVAESTFDDKTEQGKAELKKAQLMFDNGIIGQPSMYTAIVQHMNGAMMAYQLTPRQKISPKETDELIKSISGITAKSSEADMKKANATLKNLFIALPKYTEGWQHLDRISVTVIHSGKGTADKETGKGGSHLFVRVYKTPEKESKGKTLYFDNGGFNITGEKGKVMKFDTIDELLDKLNTQLEKATIKLPKLTVDNLKYQPGNYLDMESNVHANSIKGVSTTYHVPDSNGSDRIQKAAPSIPQHAVSETDNEDDNSDTGIAAKIKSLSDGYHNIDENVPGKNKVSYSIDIKNGKLVSLYAYRHLANGLLEGLSQSEIKKVFEENKNEGLVVHKIEQQNTKEIENARAFGKQIVDIMNPILDKAIQNNPRLKERFNSMEDELDLLDKDDQDLLRKINSQGSITPTSGPSNYGTVLSTIALDAKQFHNTTLNIANPKLQDNSFNTITNLDSAQVVPTSISIRKDIREDGTVYDVYLPSGKAIQLTRDITAQVLLDVDNKKYMSYDKAIESVMDKYKDTYNPLSADNKVLFSQIKNKAERIQWLKDLRELHRVFDKPENRKQIKDDINTNLRISGIRESLDREEYEDDVEEYGARNSENRFKKNASIGGIESLGKSIKKYIASTVVSLPDVGKTDELGHQYHADGTPIIQAADTGYIYNGMLKLLSGDPDESKILDKIINYIGNENNPDTTGYLRNWLNESGFNIDKYEEAGEWECATEEGANLFNATMKGFMQTSNDYYNTVVDPNNNKTFVVNANSDNTERNQFRKWSNAFQVKYQNKLQKEKSDTSRNKVYKEAIEPLERFIKETGTTTAKNRFVGGDEEHSDQALAELSTDISRSLYNGTGISLHPDYIAQSIIAAKEPEYRTELQQQNLNMYPTDVMDSAEVRTQFLDYLKTYKNPFTRPEGSDEATIPEKWILKTAKQNAPFDQSVNEMSHKNNKGETIYNFKFRNYNSDAIESLNDDKQIAKLRNDPDTQGSFLLDSSDFLFMKKKMNLVGGISLKKSFAVKDEDTDEDTGEREILSSERNKGGIDFSDYSTNEYLITMLSQYDISRQPGVEIKKSDGSKFIATNISLGPVGNKSSHPLVPLPVIHAVEQGKNGWKTSPGARDIIFNMISDEVDKITRNKQITEGTIQDYDNGDRRGDKLWRTKWLLDSKLHDADEETVGQEIERLAGTEEFDIADKRAEIIAAAEKTLRRQLSELKDLMKESGLIGNRNENILLPAFLYEGVGKSKNDKVNLIEGNFDHNLAQVVINQYLNYTGITQLLYGDESKRVPDPTQLWKRRTGYNGEGVSLNNLVSVPGTDTVPVKTFKGVTIPDDEDKSDDGQMRCTTKFFRSQLLAQGKLTAFKSAILDKLELGKPLDKKEAKEMLRLKTAINPQKVVYEDGETYLKSTTMTLLREDTSYRVGNQWRGLPLRGRNHELLNKMEQQENAGNISLAYPVSVSKGVKENIAPSVEGIENSHWQDLQADKMRMQVEIVPGKEKGAKPVQPAAQLLAEQDHSKLVHIDGEWKKTGDVIQDYMDAVQQRKENNAISAISELFTSDKPITDLDKLPELTPNMNNFMDRAVDTLLATGADSQTIELFKEHFNINLPSVREKATQIVLAHLVKGVTKETVPLWSMTAISDSGFSVIREVTHVDDNGQPIYSKCPIIPMSEFKKDPVKYSKIPYISDTLKDNVPMVDENGKTLFYYTEGLRPLLTNDEIDNGKFANEFDEGLFSRTPGTGPHSNGRGRWIDTIAVSHNTSCILPRKVMGRTGNDFDGDVFYVQRYDTYMNGNNRIAYGTAGSNDAKFQEYKRWMLDNNKSVQKLYHGDKLYSGEEATATLLSDSEVNEYRLDEVIKELKLPSTTAEFIKRGGEKLNNGVQTNKALKAQMALLSGEHVSGGGDNATINQTTSTDGIISDTKKLVDYFREPVDGKVSEYAEKLAKQLEDKGTDPNSLLGQVQAFEMNKGGSREVGAIANLIQSGSLLNQFGVKIKNGFGYEFNGQTLDNYSATKTISGLSISHQIDTLAQMILDGDKHHLNTRYGLNTEFDGYLANMIRLGQDLDTALLYPMSKVWREYAKLTARGISKELPKNADKILDGMIEDCKNATPVEFDKLKLQEYLRSGIEDKGIDLTLLQTLKQMKKLHEVQRALAKISTLDTGKNISTVDDIANLQKAYDDLGIGMSDAEFKKSDIPIDVRDIVTKKSGNFAANYKIFKVISDTALPKYLLSKSKPFMDIKSIMRKNFRVPGNDPNFDTKLDYNLNSYLSLVPYIKTLSGTERETLNQDLIWANSDSPKSIVSILQKTKDLLTDENTNYALNNFLNVVLKDSKKDVKINQIISNTWARIGEQQQAKIVGAIADMIANSNSDIHKTGVAIYNYLMVRDGGQFKNGSYMKFIPTFMMKGWSNSLDKTVEMLAKTDVQNDYHFDEHFGMTYPELAEKAIVSYVTHVNNMKYLPKFQIGSFATYKAPDEMKQELDDFNSVPVYTDSANDSIVVDMFKDIRKWIDVGEHGMVIAKGKYSNVEKEKLKKNLAWGESAGFKSVGKGLEFPFAINMNNQIYLLQRVGREQPGTLTGLLQHGEELPTGMSATYKHFTGSKGDRKQWELSKALLGDYPQTTEEKQQLDEQEPAPISTDIKQAAEQGVLTANINGRTVKIDENTGQRLDVSAKPVVPSQAIMTDLFGRPHVKGVNIISGSNDPLAAALTNPTTIAKRKGKITKDYPVVFNGETYPDAEAAYKDHKVNDSDIARKGQIDPQNNEIMQEILQAKLQQYPNLVKGITDRGGITFLEASSHVGFGNRFEGQGRQSAFVNNLIEAYKNVTEKPQPIDWKTEIDKLSTGKPEEWLETARNIYKRGIVAKLSPETILDNIKNC